MDKYVNFVNQIPKNIMEKVEKCLCSDVALFRPETFIAGKLMHSEDFHMIITSTTPPDTYVNCKLQSFSSGKIVVFNPGDTILCTGEGVKKRYLSLLIKPGFINRTAEEMGHSGPVRFLKILNPYSGELMQAISTFDREAERADTFPLMLDCLAAQIVALLLREFKTNFKRFPEKSPDMDTCIALSVEYMEAFYNANIKIADICDEINISPFHFIRTFKKKIGVSPHKYLLKIRIQKAREFLKSGRYSVSETAMLCGFVSMPHFSSTFKDMTGYSPAEYKKNIGSALE
ncbi:helix-turn-helix domain-containing protein [Lutispora saccharofermentans]|uniref:Helix-turn-helix transcriptional regulator n=1 Tax=Lutispora saccharofermentans TaxID=3024236 RepID=A0ABT1NDZ6_9FIRM|nr:AraC family transcriptional regulator [Lutispora saccharofermentans]MCQ1529472.1 helix-turn-helix transcriptional regulator [Lutispora saccharofermentans]